MSSIPARYCTPINHNIVNVHLAIVCYFVCSYRRHHGMGGSLFADFQALQRIWTHPIVLRLNAEKIERANEKKGFSSDTEGSLKDFINDDSTDLETTSSDSGSNSDVQAIDDTNVPRRKTRNNPGVGEFSISIHLDIDFCIYISFLFFIFFLYIRASPFL